MHFNVSDRFVDARSPIHQLDPRVKVLGVVLFIVSNVLLPDGAWLAFALALGLVLAASVMANLEPRYTLARSFVALPFALAAITAIFAIPGQPLFTLAVGPWRITGTDAGVIRFVSIVIRSWLSVQAAILLVATTQFPDLMHALRHLRVPNVIVTVVSLMYRYLFVLSDEVLRLLRARESRSAVPAGGKGGGSVVWRAQVAGAMAGQLFLRSYERSDRVYSAMLARGYRGELLTLNPHVMKTRDWQALALMVVGLVVVQAVSHVRVL